MSTSRKRAHSARNSAKSSGYPAQSTQITYAGHKATTVIGNRGNRLQTVLGTAKSHWKPLETGHSLGRVNGTLEPPHERYGFLRFPMTVVGLQVGFHKVSTVSMRSSPFSFARAQSPGPARKACWRMVQNLHFAPWSAWTSFARAFWLVQPLRNPSPCQDT